MRSNIRAWWAQAIILESYSAPAGKPLALKAVCRGNPATDSPPLGRR